MGDPVELRLDGIHVIVVLAVEDAADYQQGQAQWREILTQANAASIQFLYPGVPATNVANKLPRVH